MAQMRRNHRSFNEGVRAGMFTVPGDGRIDFSPLVRFVKASGYRGWMIVEAEQDLMKAPPKAAVARAFAFITKLFA